MALDLSKLPDKAIDFSKLPNKALDFSKLPDKQDTGLWDRFVKATGAESDMMSSPANAEILRNVVGGGSAWIPAGVIKAAGIVSGQREGADELANLVQEKIVGTPSTEVGKLAQKQIATPFEILSEKSQQAGDLVYDKTGSPLLATATRVAGEAIPFVAPVVVAKGLKGIKGAVKAPEIDLGKVSEKPYSITPDISAELKASVPKEVAPEIKAQKVELAEPLKGENEPQWLVDKKNIPSEHINGDGYVDNYEILINNKTKEQATIKPGDEISMGFAGSPVNFPKPWTLVKAEQKFSTVNYKNNPSITVRSASGEERVFDNANIYSPHKVEPTANVKGDIPIKAQEGVKAEIHKAETPLEGKPAKSAVDVNMVIAEKGFEALPDEELAKYNPITKADTISKIDTLLKADESSAIEMAKGNMPIPNDIQAQVLFNTVEKLAEQKGDIQTLMDLAKSPLAEQRSLSAQNLGASAWNKIKDTIVEKIQEVKKARESKITDVKMKEKVSKSLKEETQKINLSKEELSWDRFLSKIEC